MNRTRLLFAPAIVSLFLAPAAALAQDYWLIDDFAIEASARSNDLDTTIRVDGPLGLGTAVDLEEGLGLDEGEDNVGVTLEWRLGHRHLLGAGWASYQRDTTRTISQEIRIRDTVFPVNVDVRTEFDIETLTVSYHYFLVLHDRVAFGIGGGLRNYDFRIAAAVNQLGLAESADVSGPLPFVSVDWRYGLSPRWRLRANAGYFDIEIDQYNGSQVLAGLALEFKALEHLGFGVAGDIGQLDVDVDANRWDGAIDSDIVGLRAFARVLW